MGSTLTRELLRICGTEAGASTISADIELVISSSGQEAPPFLCIKDQIWTRVLGISKICFIVQYCYLDAGIAVHIKCSCANEVVTRRQNCRLL